MSDLNDVSFKLGQIDGKLDQVLEALKAHVKDDAKKHDDSDGRIAKLEQSKSWLYGVSAGIGVVVTTAWNLLVMK